MPKIFAYIQFLSFCLPELSTVFLQTGDKSFFSLRSHGTGKFLINFARTDVLYENRFRLLRAHSIAVLHREDLQGACPPQWFYCYARNRVLIAGKVFALALCSRYVGPVALVRTLQYRQFRQVIRGVYDTLHDFPQRSLLLQEALDGLKHFSGRLLYEKSEWFRENA